MSTDETQPTTDVQDQTVDTVEETPVTETTTAETDAPEQAEADTSPEPTTGEAEEPAGTTEGPDLTEAEEVPEQDTDPEADAAATVASEDESNEDAAEIDPPVTGAAGQTTTSAPALDDQTAQLVATVDSALASYCDKMAPGKPMDTKTGAQNQITLYHLLNNVAHAPIGFKEAWSKVLEYFHAHKDGAMHESRVFRFAADMPGLPEEHMKFHRLVNLAKVTADPATRAVAAKQDVSIYKTMQEGFTEQARNNMNNFYK